jgi:hypothetical protein
MTKNYVWFLLKKLKEKLLVAMQELHGIQKLLGFLELLTNQLKVWRVAPVPLSHVASLAASMVARTRFFFSSSCQFFMY